MICSMYRSIMSYIEDDALQDHFIFSSGDEKAQLKLVDCTFCHVTNPLLHRLVPLPNLLVWFDFHLINHEFPKDFWCLKSVSARTLGMLGLWSAMPLRPKVLSRLKELCWWWSLGRKHQKSLLQKIRIQCIQKFSKKFPIFQFTQWFLGFIHGLKKISSRGLGPFFEVQELTIPGGAGTSRYVAREPRKKYPRRCGELCGLWDDLDVIQMRSMRSMSDVSCNENSASQLSTLQREAPEVQDESGTAQKTRGHYDLRVSIKPVQTSKAMWWHNLQTGRTDDGYIYIYILHHVVMSLWSWNVWEYDVSTQWQAGRIHGRLVFASTQCSLAGGAIGMKHHGQTW